MDNHQEKAVSLFNQGYNCAQSVFAAFCDVTGMDVDTALKLSSSFGGGMGRLREVCGAVSGMFMTAGLLYGYSSTDDQDAKAEHYKLIQSLAKKFELENGSIICRELLGLSQKHDDPTPEERTKSYYHTRPCAEYVRYAAQLMDELIQKKGTENEKIEAEV